MHYIFEGLCDLEASIGRSTCTPLQTLRDALFMEPIHDCNKCIARNEKREDPEDQLNKSARKVERKSKRTQNGGREELCHLPSISAPPKAHHPTTFSSAPSASPPQSSSTPKP
jgi:hypothetical protein